jgi:hypothetical protein
MQSVAMGRWSPARTPPICPCVFNSQERRALLAQIQEILAEST